MFAIEITKVEFSVDIIDDDCHQYVYFTRKLLDRDKYIAVRKKELDQMEAFGVVRRVKKSEGNDGTHVRMKVIASVGWVTGCDDFLYESRVAHELEYRVVITSCARQRETSWY